MKAKVVWVYDDAGCLLEAATPVDPFDGVEVSTYDGQGSVRHFLQSSLFLGICVSEPGCDATSQCALYSMPAIAAGRDWTDSDCCVET